jgi:hypothetical protein
MALSGLDDILNRVTGGAGSVQNLWWHKYSQNTMDSNPVAMGNLWQQEGLGWGAGATPTSAAVPTNTTPGSLIHSNPGGGNKLWMVGLTSKITGGGILVFYDRLLHCGGLSGTVTTAQTVGGSLTRYTNGVGNMILAEVYTQIGSGAVTITGSYTNQAGTGSQTIPTDVSVFPMGGGTHTPGSAIILPLASGDTGVQALASVTLGSTTNTAGNWGVSIIHPLFAVAGSSTSGGYNLELSEWISEIPSNTCLGAYWMKSASTVSYPITTGHMVLVEDG